ncbi:MAG: DegV family protein [Acidimicrobiaceae bacterium]|nr:DegV family protein [Acidimicrobiaceae bacterium]
MTKIRVVCDSASDLPQSELDRLQITMVSLSIRFGEEEFVDRVTLSTEEFWRRCAQSRTLPETSAPSPGAFRTAYEEAVADGCSGVIVIVLSSALSGTYQSALVAAESMAQLLDVRVVDSQAVSMAQGLLAIDVAERSLEGASLDELEQHALALRSRLGVVAMLDTLDHLIKGGRVGGAKALIGQVLSIKPLLELHDGLVAEAGRQRTTSRAMASISATAKSHAPLRRLALIHAQSDQVAALRALVADISVEFPMLIADMGPTVGTHGGPGLIGLTWLEARGNEHH